MMILTIPQCASALSHPVVPTNVQRAEIPSQPLQTALDQFSRAAGINVTYEPGLIAGRMSASTRTDIDPRLVLQRMLEGTGLEAVYTNAQSVRIIATRGRLELEASALAAQSGADLVLGSLVVDVSRRVGVDTRFNGYADLMRREVHLALASHPDLQDGDFQQDFALKVGPNGEVVEIQALEVSQGVELAGQTAQTVISGVRFSLPPPSDMPQPVRLRVRGRGGR